MRELTGPPLEELELELELELEELELEELEDELELLDEELELLEELEPVGWVLSPPHAANPAAMIPTIMHCNLFILDSLVLCVVLLRTSATARSARVEPSIADERFDFGDRRHKTVLPKIENWSTNPPSSLGHVVIEVEHWPFWVGIGNSGLSISTSGLGIALQDWA